MKRPVTQAAGVILLMVAAFMAGHITTAVSQTGPTLKRPPGSGSTVRPPRTPSPQLRLKKYQCAHGNVTSDGLGSFTYDRANQLVSVTGAPSTPSP